MTNKTDTKPRIIKFRVWSTMREPRMLYLNPSKKRFSSKDLITSSNWKVMQYTGLKDKKGKEIYIGDILAYEDISKFGAFNGVKKKVVKESVQGWNIKDASQWEIIGNIYQNSELLK